MLGLFNKIWLIFALPLMLACQDKVGVLQEDEISSLDPEGSLVLGELVLSPDEREIMVGERFPLNALIFFPYQRTEDVSRETRWESSSPDLMLIETELDGSYLRALAEGTVTLSARYKEKSAKSILTVASNTVENAFLGVAQKTIVLSRLQSSYVPADFTATLVGVLRDGRSTDLNAEAAWESSDTSRLKLIRPGQFQALAPGEVTITVRWSEKSFQQNVRIDAVDRVMEGLELSAPARVLALQTPEAFHIEAVYNDGTRDAVTSLASFSVAHPHILRVDTSPNFRLVGLQEGSTTLTAQFGGKTLQASVRVVDPFYQSLRLAVSSSSTIPLGGSEVWKAYLVFSDGSEEDVSTRVVWTSSAPLIAEVSVLETEKGRIYGRRLGNATLQANFFGLLQSVPVSVGGARAKTLEVQSLSSGTLGLYLSRDFKAFADFTDGIRREVTNSVSWSIESLGGNAYFDPASKGRLVSTASGDVRVLARLQGQEVIQTLTVGTVVPVFVQILGADTIVSLTASSPRALTTRVTMSDGAMVDRTSATEWTYTTTGEGLNFAAYVENGEGRKGLCTPLRAGKIRVTASFSGLETSAVVEVQ